MRNRSTSRLWVPLYVQNTHIMNENSHNISSNFTKSFKQSGMFEDTSIIAATKEKLNTGKHKESQVFKTVKKDHFIEKWRKLKLIQDLCAQYPNINVPKGLVYQPEELIHNHFHQRIRKAQRVKAALKLQSAWRAYRVRIYFKREKQRIETMVIRVQRYFRRTIRKRKRDNIQVFQRVKAALTIQRIWRGYCVRHQRWQYLKQCLDKKLAIFSEMRDRNMEEEVYIHFLTIKIGKILLQIVEKECSEKYSGATS